MLHVFNVRTPLALSTHAGALPKRLVLCFSFAFLNGRSALLLVLDILFQKSNQIRYPKILQGKMAVKLSLQ